MAIKGWTKIIDDEWYATGGGFNYWLTFYRNNKNPLKQIEIWHEENRNGKRAKPGESMNFNKPIGINIGTRYENIPDEYDPIQGNYIWTGEANTLKQAKAIAHKYMRSHPNG